MIVSGLHNEQYHTSRELGKGGEGVVWELEHHADLVCKIYNTPPDADKQKKLRVMAEMCTPALEAYAAWPCDVAQDAAGNIIGFVMKKLTAYVPMHTAFSPMDRKKLFPDKGYNFLVHIARNLATAFHNIHAAGIVAGDINEGNILINASGFVSFIDCDSFQMRQPDRDKKYFFCEVGVPRYTPPELLKKGTFENVVRTVNTDSFSMAVLIFQLLFLGRHPFAGKNKTDKDIDEETAIRTGEFAYSLTAKRKKLVQPDVGFDIRNLPDAVVDLFHRAFEEKQRPTPAEWIAALNDLLSGMATCPLTKLHTYPAGMDECPWCRFRQEKGILYFLDDSYIQATRALEDIDRFVNGFRLDALRLRPVQRKPFGSAPVVPPPAQEYRQCRKNMAIAGMASILAGTALLSVSPVFLPAGLGLAVGIWVASPWRTRLNKELARLKGVADVQRRAWKTLQNSADLTAEVEAYNKLPQQIEAAVAAFKNLPEDYSRFKKEMEEQVYADQLNDYLRCFKLAHQEIPAIGDIKKKALADGGITSAADVSQLLVTKVPGIGPKNMQVLLDWQRKVATNFIYIPDHGKLAEGLRHTDAKVAALRARLESQIRKGYQDAEYAKMQLDNKLALHELRMVEQHRQWQRAEAELAAFEKLLAPPLKFN